MKPFASFLAAALLCLAPAAQAAEMVRAISASDKAQGARAHPQLLEEFGGAYTGPQAAYVEKVGKRIALQSGLSNSEKDFTVTLLNSPVNNAFAIPGGYVYVTRQLLALMNDEAELASVLGHEVGHVAARHAAKRNSRATLGNILAAGVGIVTGQSALGNLAGTAAQLYTLKFSRTQEYQADDLGIGYLRKAGYDPMAAADMLASLNAISLVEAKASGADTKGVPSWASTHPNTVDRVARARKLALPVTGPAARNREAFLTMLDGLLYDDDPAQGIVDEPSFRHPLLKLGFTAPAGAVLTNGSSAISIRAAGGEARFAGGALGGGGLAAYLDRAFRTLAGSNASLSYGEIRSGTINGIETAMATARATTSSGPIDVTILAYRFAPDAAYHFTTLTPQGSGLGVFEPMTRSFHRLSETELAAIKPRRVRIVTVQPGDSPASLAQRMAYPASERLERFLALNGLAANATLRPGQKVKLILLG